MVLLFAKKKCYHGSMFYGFNSLRNIRNGGLYPLHAEMDAIEKSQHQIKKNKSYDIVVIRVDKNGILKNSRPCYKCIEWMLNCRQYKINRIYYSDTNSNIICKKLYTLSQEPRHLSKRFKN